MFWPTHLGALDQDPMVRVPWSKSQWLVLYGAHRLKDPRAPCIWRLFCPYSSMAANIEDIIQHGDRCCAGAASPSVFRGQNHAKPGIFWKNLIFNWCSDGYSIWLLLFGSRWVHDEFHFSVPCCDHGVRFSPALLAPPGNCKHCDLDLELTGCRNAISVFRTG